MGKIKYQIQEVITKTDRTGRESKVLSLRGYEPTKPCRCGRGPKLQGSSRCQLCKKDRIVKVSQENRLRERRDEYAKLGE